MYKKKYAKYKGALEELLQGSGIYLEEDIQVHNSEFYKAAASLDTLKVGILYEQGAWDCQNLFGLFTKLLEAKIDDKVRAMKTPADIWRNRRILTQRLIDLIGNRQSIRRSKKVTEEHYDAGVNFFLPVLGSTLQYTCAIFVDPKTGDTIATDLNQAQINKMQKNCADLELKSEDSVIEIGCGWGNNANNIAEQSRCRVTAFNLSAQQIKYAKIYNHHPNVEFIHADYREALKTQKSRHNKGISTGLLEHVGKKNHRTHFIVLYESLQKPGDLASVHTIARNISRNTLDPYYDERIFYGGLIPSDAQITRAIEGLFAIKEWYNIGPQYVPTLLFWDQNLLDNWDELKDKEDDGGRFRYDEQFLRKYHYYFSSSAAAFATGNLQVNRMILSRDRLVNQKSPVIFPQLSPPINST